MQPLKEDDQPYERLEARVAPNQKALFQCAARLSGRSLTDFAISTMQEVTNRIVQEHEVIRLSLQDQLVFVEAVFHATPKSNKSLLSAAKRFNKIIKCK